MERRLVPLREVTAEPIFSVELAARCAEGAIRDPSIGMSHRIGFTRARDLVERTRLRPHENRLGLPTLYIINRPCTRKFPGHSEPAIDPE